MRERKRELLNQMKEAGFSKEELKLFSKAPNRAIESELDAERIFKSVAKGTADKEILTWKP